MKKIAISPKIIIAISLIGCLVIGYFAGREHVKYTFRKTVTEAFKPFEKKDLQDKSEISSIETKEEKPAPEKPHIPEKEKPSNIIEFTDYKIQSLPSDYSGDRKPYSAHVKAYFQFKNKSSKTLTGLEYEVNFLDSFGDILYKTILKDQLKIAPGKTNPMDTFWYWEDNEFIPGQPYDNLHAAAGAGTIKVRIIIKRVVFDDGSIISF